MLRPLLSTYRYRWVVRVPSISHSIFLSSSVNIRVHSLDKRCCRLHIKLDTKAKDILKEACSKLSLNVDEHELCEGKSSGEKYIYKEEDLSISTEMTVNGRLYVVPKDGPKTIVRKLSF